MTDVSGAAGGLVGGVGGLVGDALGVAGAVAGPVLEHVAGAGDTLAGLAAQVGAPVAAVLDANPHLAGLDLLPPGARVILPLPAPAPPLSSAPSPAPAAPPTSPLQAPAPAAPPPPAPGAPTAGAPPAPAASAPQPSGPGAEWRIMTQAGPAVAAPAAPAANPAAAAAEGPPVLAAVTPELVARTAEALPELPAGLPLLAAEALAGLVLTLPPELQAPTPLTLAAALSRVGWLPVAAGAARPGDVVIVLTAEGLRAVRVPAEGLAALPAVLAEGDAPPVALRSPLEGPAVVREPQVQPPGFDAAAPAARRERGRGREGGRERRRSSDAPDPRRDWIDRILPIAKWIKAKWGVPVAVTVAHSALQSDWGRDAAENDVFGLLKLRRAGAAATPLRNAARDDAPGYATLDEAADDYGAFLRGDRRLAAAFARRDVLGFVRDLAGAGGWGGEARFGERLACLISLNGLDAFDAA